MSIEEKAKDYAGYNIPSSQDIVTTASHVLRVPFVPGN